MNKRVLGLFVLGLFAIVMVSGFASAGFFGNIFGKITGQVVGTGALPYNCTDSDRDVKYVDGNNPFVKGTTKGYNLQGTYGSITDVCVDSTKVMEAFCQADGKHYSVTNARCANGCADGACKSSGGGGGGCGVKYVCVGNNVYTNSSCSGMTFNRTCSSGCLDGVCVVGCTPQCAGKQCGVDGCGGFCGTCPTGQTCDVAGRCTGVLTCKQMGDVNNDCVINALDLQIVTSNFGKTTSVGDVNGDGVVNALDMALVQSNFGKSSPADCQCGGGATCTDSDGGLNYNIKGYVNTSVSPGTVFEDYCLNSLNLIERHCLGSNPNNFTVQYTCPNRCADGACISEGNYVKTCDSTVALDLTNSGTTLAFSWDDGASTGFKVLKLTVVTSDGANRTTIIDKATGVELCTDKKKGDVCHIGGGVINIVDVYSRSNGEKGVVLSVGQYSKFNELGACSGLCEGDVNHDCFINAIDVNLVQSNFGKTGSTGDANGDGVVNALDMALVQSNFGKTCAQMNKSCGEGSCKDYVQLERATDRLEIGETLRAVFGSSTATKDHLKLFLADGSYKVKDTAYKYEQTITLGSALTLQNFSDADYNNRAYTVGIRVVPNTAILNYTLAFPLGVKSSIGTGADCAVGHLCDIEGTTMHMLGADYSVLSATLDYMKLQKLSGDMETVEINNTEQSVKVNGMLANSLRGLLTIMVQPGGGSAKLDKLILRWKSTDKLFLAAETPLSMPLNAIGFSMILVKGDPSADAVVSLYGVLPSEYCGGGGGGGSGGDATYSSSAPSQGFFARAWARITGRAI